MVRARKRLSDDSGGGRTDRSSGASACAGRSPDVAWGVPSSRAGPRIPSHAVLGARPLLRTTLTFAGLSAALIAAPGAAHAEAAAEVDQVIVTAASRTDLEPREIGSAVTVKTAEDIRRQQFQALPQLFQQTPGVQITSDRPGGSTGVSIRGSENDQVLYLIDGVELGDPSTISGQFSTEHLTTFDIARVEILRGNQSSLYGADAIGGVVNIVTQRATEDGVRLNAEVEGGAHGMLSGGASLFGKQGALDYRATLTGYKIDGPSLASPVFGPATEDDGYDRWSASGRVGYQFTDQLEGQLLGFYTESSNDLDGTGEDSADTAEKRESGVSAQLRHHTADNRWRNTFTVGRYAVKRKYFGTYNLPEGDLYDGEKVTYDYATAFDLSQAVRLAGGLNYQTEDTDQATLFSAPLHASIDTRAAFAEAALRPTQAVTVTLAARVDDNSRFGTFDTYRVTGAWILPVDVAGGQMKLRASWGTGAKAPGLYQLFDPTYGNPNLEVAESQGYDGGVDFSWPRASVEATLFHNKVKNEIGFDFFAGGYIQFGETESNGLELGATAQLTDWLRLEQSYTYLDAQDAETDTWLGRPRHSGSTSLTVAPGEGWQVTARARYRSKNAASYGGTTGDFAVVDLLGAYRLNPTFELFGRVENLFDTDYAVVFGERTLGRSAYAGVRAAF